MSEHEIYTRTKWSRAAFHPYTQINDPFRVVIIEN